MISSGSNPGAAHVILIIDDDEGGSRLLAQQLNAANYTAVVKLDGKSALEWLNEHQADLIVLDMMLPEMDGLQITRRLRTRYSARVLPILMISAHGQQSEVRVQGFEAGANDFLAKPYHLRELIARIHGLLQVKEEADHVDSLLSRYMSKALRQQADLDPDIFKTRRYRNAVIMFADMRGFSRLTTEVDVGDMLEVLDDFFDSMMSLVKQFGGMVFDLTGDELLAGFNVPYDVPVPSFVAVQTALEMQVLFDSLRSQWTHTGIEFGLGVGMNQGAVMLGDVGASELMRYTVMGNTVNVAHRLMEIAEPGDIILSADIFNEVEPFLKDIDVKALKGVSLKGIETPQLVYRLRKLA